APLKELPVQARKQMGITVDGDDGVVVQSVRRGSPAASAGLQVYDVILQANRRKIGDTAELNTIIQSLKVGDTLALLISRDGQSQNVTVTLKERPQDFDMQQMRRQTAPQLAPDQGQDQGPDQQSPF
ncbi:MAG: trypsin-like serine protease with C-terminal domain, partial [Capsulimonas sp.]|nr:trypsin-like serine protease with C-terminal domain [Capsulimonas sp.]